MDDLSFEDFEIEYKYLKAVIEEDWKRNRIISDIRYIEQASSCREKFSDKEERRDDLHSSDTVQEKLSLVSRFGVSIFSVPRIRRNFRIL